MRRICVLSVCVLAAAALGANLFPAEWPGWRGPNRDGISPEKGINRDWTAKPPKELWRFKMGDGGQSGPAVADGKVFIIDHKGPDDVVRALDINTGNEVWSFPYPEPGGQDHGFARATPLVENGKVYTLSQLGTALCLDAKKGTKIWEKNIIEEFGGRLPQWKLATSPVIDGDKLLLCPGGSGAAVVALNKDTGVTIWKGGGSDVAGYAGPVIATINGKKQYVVFTGFNLMGVDPADGKVLWKFAWKTSYDVNAATPVAVGNGAVFITTGYRHGCALVQVTADGAAAAWENKNIQAHFSSPVLQDGYLYGNSDPDHLVCLDAKTGDVAWRQGGFEKGGIVALAPSKAEGADGVIIAQNGTKGTLIMAEMSPKGYKELGRIDALRGTGSPTWSAPIVAEGKLLARSPGALVCFDLK